MSQELIRKKTKHASEDHYFMKDLGTITDAIHRKRFVSDLENNEYQLQQEL